MDFGVFLMDNDEFLCFMEVLQEHYGDGDVDGVE
mgnify:CR=1 FL=1